MLWNFPSAATVLNSVQPQLQTNNQAVFQPQAASVQQVPSQQTQVTSAQVSAAQVAAAQATSATTTVSQPSISVAALQTAGLSINPAIVRMPLQRLTFLLMCCLHLACESCVFLLLLLLFSAQISAASLGAQPQFLSSLTSTPIITSAMSNMAGITSQIITNAQGQVGATNYSYCHQFLF